MFVSKALLNLDLAAATHSLSESDTTPFPIGVGRNGSCVVAINSRTAVSAHAYAAPDVHKKC